MNRFYGLYPLNRKRLQFALPRVDATNTIPRIIHQTCPRRLLSRRLAENIARIQEVNPGWSYRLYDDDDVVSFIETHYNAEMLKVYQSISPLYGAARADLFRYLVIYKLGGAYLDIKSTTVEPLSDHLQASDQFILSQWRNGPADIHENFGCWPDLSKIEGGEFQQWHVISVPGHLFLESVIQAVVANIRLYYPWIHGTGQLGVLRLTGPIAYTLAIAPLISSEPCRIVADETKLGLQYSIFEGVSHRKTLGSHYRQIEEPIVVSSAFKAAVVQSHRLFRRLLTGRLEPLR